MAGEVTDPKTIRRCLERRDGWGCKICGITEWQGEKVPLIADHINGNAADNSAENLRLICPNCDAQLPTFKARNKGNGRPRRRKLDTRDTIDYGSIV